MLGRRCGEPRERGTSRSSGSKCRDRRCSRRLGRFPGKMAVGLAAPLSLLPRRRERAALGSRPPTPRRVLPGGVRSRTWRGWGAGPSLGCTKSWGGRGRRRRLPLCGSPPLPHTVRATSPPPLRPPGPLPLRGSPLALAPPAEGRGPCPFGWRGAASFWHGAERRKESNGAVTLRCRHRGPGAGRGGRSAEAGRGPKSRYPGGGGAKARRPRLSGTRGNPNGALSFSRAIGPGAPSWAFRVQVESEAGARWAASELQGKTGCPPAPESWLPSKRILSFRWWGFCRLPLGFVYFLSLGRSPM